jgi:opine dehydrogenase
VTSVAVLGAGAGGVAAVAELTQKGHEVSLWNRSAATIASFQEIGGVAYEGALGKGKAVTRRITTDLADALDGAELAVVCLPAVAHEEVALAMARLSCGVPIILDPGGTGGALLFRRAFKDEGATLPPIVEMSTLTYIARKTEPAKVSVFAVAKKVHAACLPGGEQGLDAADTLFGRVSREPHVLSTSLRNINLVLHPPVALLSAAWVEATGGDFLVYSQAVTPGVFALMEALDTERKAVGAAVGLELPSLVDEMSGVGSVDEDAYRRGDRRGAIVRGEANASIKAPSSLEHRYYQEDLPFAVLPFTEVARACVVPTPVADAILTVASSMLGSDPRSLGLNSHRLGIQGVDSAARLLEIVEVGP